MVVTRGLLCPVHLATTLHWQLSEHLWEDITNALQSCSKELLCFCSASRWFPHRCSEGCQWIVVVRWMGSCMPLMQLVFNTKANLSCNHTCHCKNTTVVLTKFGHLSCSSYGHGMHALLLSPCAIHRCKQVMRWQLYCCCNDVVYTVKDRVLLYHQWLK